MITLSIVVGSIILRFHFFSHIPFYPVTDPASQLFSVVPAAFQLWGLNWSLLCSPPQHFLCIATDNFQKTLGHVSL